MVVEWEIYLSGRHLEQGIDTQITFGGRMKYLTYINLVSHFYILVCKLFVILFFSIYSWLTFF